jgi:hypothetical protein
MLFSSRSGIEPILRAYRSRWPSNLGSRAVADSTMR